MGDVSFVITMKSLTVGEKENYVDDGNNTTSTEHQQTFAILQNK